MEFKGAGAGRKKLTVEFSDDLAQRIGRLADKKGVSKVDVLRRAIALYDYAESEAGSGTDKSLSITKDGKAVKDIVLP